MTAPLDILWTAGTIGRFLRLGNDGVYALARETDAPIYKSGGRLYAFEGELTAWMQRPENRRSPTNPKAA
ncbi:MULTISPECIES: hypothetical protein [unclassified Aureimonas]|uniref:hypothetical protein n=1 Tax=unclassified Aureimonas TaxID=2615206 RepID=UPI0006FB68CB|nr:MULTISPECIES: hypothetical protein [unclassified Aureimonas]KQT57485.1 hypothetical protein ASG62_09200 [Aureimonas sp. Leaf427]KQT77165.1 hypothetical protein ASG54_13070 [Aureimonas sp. Leaf460]